MSKIRTNRVGEQIKKELTDIIATEVKDPRVGFVTITAVEASGDLQHVKVFVSIMGKTEEREATMAALDRATGFIRSEVAKRIRLRHVPTLLFRLDTSIDYSDRINSVLRDITRTEENQR